jgi:Pyruvate/2-oxoacid:ferredoxin oxidoreductase delta subunit
MDEYFKDIFQKAASNSRSPWARIIPSLGAIEAIITENPEYYDERKITIINLIRRIGEIAKYGARNLMKKLISGKISDVINTLKSDGLSVASRITSLSGLRTRPIKYSPIKKNGTKPKIEKTIPINEKIPMILKIYPYEVIRQYIEQATTISVTPCPCRKVNRLLDETCDETLKIRCKFLVEDTCLHLRYEDQVVNKYNLKGGHIISKEEALNILNQCEKAGLVHTSFNSSEKIEFVCNCCPCCCGILGTMTKHHQKYRAFVESNFQPIHQKTQCIKCTKCMQICPVHAISQNEEGFPIIDLEICIGCGVCVTNCSKKALKLVKIRNRFPAIDTIEALVKFSNQKVKK